MFFGIIYIGQFFVTLYSMADSISCSCESMYTEDYNSDKLHHFHQIIEQLENKKTINEDINNIPIIKGLEGYRINNNGNETGVVLIHGLGGTPFDLGSIALRLLSNNTIISSVRLPGHATNNFDLRKYKSDDWIKAVNKEIDWVLSKNISGVHLIGHSIGGVIALLIAANRPNTIKSVVTMGSPIKFPSYKKYIIKFLDILNIAHTRPDIHTIDTTIKNLPGWKNVMDNYKKISFKVYNNVIKLCEQLDKKMVDITCPVMTMHNQQDQVIDVDNAIHIYNSISSKNKTLRIFERGGHLMMFDIDYQNVEDEIESFINKIEQN